MDLRKAEFLSIDLETTGLNAKKDEILSIGAVPMHGTRIMAGETYYRVIRPKRFKIESIKYHGLDPRELEKAPTFSEVADEVYRLLEGKILVGYAIEMDYQFLRRALKEEGYKLSNKKIDIIDLEKAICFILGEKCGEDMSLDNMARKYGIKTSYRHNALADAFITAQIFQVQLLKIIKYGLGSVDKLFELIKRCNIDRGFGSVIF